MAYKVIILYRLYMPSYFLGTFTEYPQVYFEEIASLGELYMEIQTFIVNHFYTVHTYLISILSLSVGEKPGI